jgi:hypothetical protein
LFPSGQTRIEGNLSTTAGYGIDLDHGEGNEPRCAVRELRFDNSIGSSTAPIGHTAKARTTLAHSQKFVVLMQSMIAESGEAWHIAPMRKYIPLSQRSPEMIRAQAAMYPEMAATARTAEAKRGLEKLAVLMSGLADKREAATSEAARPHVRHPEHAMELASAAD